MDISDRLALSYYDPDKDPEFHEILSLLTKGQRVEVASKPESYKFIMAMTRVVQAAQDFNLLAQHLIKLQNQYHPDEFVFNWLDGWILDCHIAAQDYETYIAKKENDLSSPYGVGANLNILVYFQVGREPRALDLMWLAENRKSKFIKAYFAEYLSAAKWVFKQYAEPHGGWKKIMADYGLLDKVYGEYLFRGLGCYPPINTPFPSYCLYTSSELNEILKTLQRDAESLARERMGMKRVGEGWVSETILFNRLKQHFPETKVIQHGRPKWLSGQHFDVWFPDWLVAVEFHGKQHFEPVEFFGGEAAFIQTKKRDRLKKYRCTRNKVTLIIVQEGYNFDDLIKKIILSRKIEN